MLAKASLFSVFSFSHLLLCLGDFVESEGTIIVAMAMTDEHINHKSYSPSCKLVNEYTNSG